MKSEVITCMGLLIYMIMCGSQSEMRKINMKIMWLTCMGSANSHNYNMCANSHNYVHYHIIL